MMTLKELLIEENLNSRFVYLANGLTVCVCVLALVIAIICKGQPENEKVLDAFNWTLGVLLGGGVGNAAGRWMTTKKSHNQTPGESTEEVVRTVRKVVIPKDSIAPVSGKNKSA